MSERLLYKPSSEANRGQEQTPHIETVRLGKLTLDAIVPFDHRQGPLRHPFSDKIIRNYDDLAKYFPIIKQRVTDPSITGVLAEYFTPTEMTKKVAKRAGQDTNAEMIYRFFDPVERFVHAKGKPIYVMDPAHDMRWGFVRGEETVVPFAAGLSLALYQGFKLHDNRKTMSRKELLRRAATGLAGVGMLSYGFGSDFIKETDIPTENTLRQIIVSKGIIDLAHQLNSSETAKPEQLLVLYPTVHWQKIYKYLQDPDRLQRDFTAVELLLKPQGFMEDFFQARKYTPTRKGWKRETSSIS